MRQSELYIKTRRKPPRDEVAKNAKLLIKGGFVNKEMAGVYSYLPIGVRVLRKIEQIIREEMDNIGGREILLTALQDPEVWKKTGRWNDKVIDNWFKTRDDAFGLGSTHEEELANLMAHHIDSYKDLPAYLYQIQTKFRNEPRAKSGLLRGREFIMKDLYSFNRDEKGLDEFYKTCAGAYRKIFDRVGVGDITYFTFASGRPFSEFSHEFQTLCDTGEDTIYLDEKKKIAINKEVYTDEVIKDVGLKKENLVEKKAIEVGNIFKLGTRYSEALGLRYVDENGKENAVVMGSYGIGLGRLMATIVEVFSDDKGIVWPESVAPFRVHLLELEEKLGEELYRKLQEKGIEVLYDNRELTAGEKFNDADLIGIPWRFVVSDKTKGEVECKKRTEEKVEVTTYDKAIRKLL